MHGKLVCNLHSCMRALMSESAKAVHHLGRVASFFSVTMSDRSPETYSDDRASLQFTYEIRNQMWFFTRMHCTKSNPITKESLYIFTVSWANLHTYIHTAHTSNISTTSIKQPLIFTNYSSGAHPQVLAAPARSLNKGIKRKNATNNQPAMEPSCPCSSPPWIVLDQAAADEGAGVMGTTSDW